LSSRISAQRRRDATSTSRAPACRCRKESLPGLSTSKAWCACLMVETLSPRATRTGMRRVRRVVLPEPLQPARPMTRIEKSIRTRESRMPLAKHPARLCTRRKVASSPTDDAAAGQAARRLTSFPGCMQRSGMRSGNPCCGAPGLLLRRHRRRRHALLALRHLVLLLVDPQAVVLTRPVEVHLAVAHGVEGALHAE